MHDRDGYANIKRLDNDVLRTLKVSIKRHFQVSIFIVFVLRLAFLWKAVSFHKIQWSSFVALKKLPKYLTTR